MKHTFRLQQLTIVLAFLIALVWMLLHPVSSIASEDELSAPQSEAPSKPTALVTATGINSNRWMVVLCSLVGDQEHETRLTESVKQLLASADSVFGVQPDHIHVLLSSKEMANAIPGAKPCNRESLNALEDELEKASDSQSEHLFFVLGHSHLDGKSCKFNLEGPDIDQSDYAKLFLRLPGKEQLHWIAIPASGYWIKPLTAPNRIVITATEADREITATEMPYALGSILDGTASFAKLEDLDSDGKLTLLDLYVAVSIEVNQSFVTQGYLPTEHAQLDDNGDGRGAELQAPFLPKTPNEPPVSKSVRKILDGDQTRRFLLGLPVVKDEPKS